MHPDPLPSFSRRLVWGNPDTPPGYIPLDNRPLACHDMLGNVSRARLAPRRFACPPHLFPSPSPAPGSQRLSVVSPVFS